MAVFVSKDGSVELERTDPREITVLKGQGFRERKETPQPEASPEPSPQPRRMRGLRAEPADEAKTDDAGDAPAE